MSLKEHLLSITDRLVTQYVSMRPGVALISAARQSWFKDMAFLHEHTGISSFILLEAKDLGNGSTAVSLQVTPEDIAGCKWELWDQGGWISIPERNCIAKTLPFRKEHLFPGL